MGDMSDKSAYFSDYDSYLFHEGTGYEVYKKMGAHPCTIGDQPGTLFTLWAPNALSASVICARTGWENFLDMRRKDNGIWELFVPWVGNGDAYRYAVLGADGCLRYKSDPYGFRSELRPDNASIVSALDTYTWHDESWMSSNGNDTVLEKPMAIYEVHLGSWKKDWSRPGGFLNYGELAKELAEYVNFMGYTHVELIGICEYPYDGSWGYQVTGYFSPTSRYGTPDDFRYFVDYLHQHDIGVILDWVPAHFPKDPYSLERFDGTALYEPADPLAAEFPEWGTYMFDYKKPEIRTFLISSAFYWINEFHIDALRVDAVAAMFFNSFSRAKWRLNANGGNENLYGMEFLRQLNQAVRSRTRGYLIGEDSSIVAGVTKDVKDGGFGFMLKWNMGWMNDILKYIGKDPVYRKWHHGNLTHVVDYAFTENWVLVLSHDEVVHLKRSMLYKFPGTIEEKLGGLKTLYTFFMTNPGKKLLFMGQDFAEDREWDENREINWSLASDFGHRDVMLSLQKLLSIYRKYPALYSDSLNSNTFEWVNSSDADRNIISYIRRNPWNYDGAVLVVCSFSPMAIQDYACGVPHMGKVKRIFSTFDTLPGGGSPEEIGHDIVLQTTYEPCDGRKCRITYSLRPYESVIFELPPEPGSSSGSNGKSSRGTTAG